MAKRRKPTKRQIAEALAETDDPQRLTLEARAIQMGLHPKHWKLMRSPALSEPAGRAIVLLRGVSTGHALWALYAAYTNCEERYHRRCHGTTLSAKVSKTEYLPESLTVDPDEEPDLRDEDEKHRDAVNNWHAWQDNMTCISDCDRRLILSIYCGHVAPIIGNRVTPNGKKFVNLLEVVSEYINSKKK